MSSPATGMAGRLATASVVERLAQDIRLAVRSLRREPAFTLTAIAVLGLGIGVNNMLFTMVHAHTLRGLPIHDVERVLDVSTIDERGQPRGLSFADFETLRTAGASSAAIAAFTNATLTVADDERAADRLAGSYVSANVFAVLGIRPRLGRSFDAAVDTATTTPAILGARAFRSRYQANPDVLGRTILVNDRAATVIGVMPDPSGFPGTAEIWLPLDAMPGVRDPGTRSLRVIGRVHGTVGIAEARGALEAAVANLPSLDAQASRGLRPRAIPLNERVVGRLTDPAWMAFTAASLLVLLVSCANAANLLLSRAVDRGREVAIRSALDASRLRLVEQLLLESLVLAACGGLLGLGISLAGIRVVRSIVPAEALPYWMTYRMDGPVFAALVAVSLAAVLLFGVAPAWVGSKPHIREFLENKSRAERRGSRWLTFAFQAAQIGLTVILLAYVVLDVLRSPPTVPSDATLAASGVMTAAISLPNESFGEPARRLAFYRQIQDRFSALPGVDEVSLTSALPLGGSIPQRVEIDQRPLGAGEQAPAIGTIAIEGGYFNTLRLPIVSGREFDPLDGSPGRDVAIVNQRFVDVHLRDGDPIGRRIRLAPASGGSPSAPWLTIVGIAPAIRQRSDPVPEPLVYVPFRAAPASSAVFLIRSGLDHEVLAARLRETVRRLDARLPLYRIQTIARVLDEARWVGRMSSGIVRFLTGVSLGLALIGLYVVTARMVARRARELAVRVALGAQPGHIRRLVVRRASVHVAAGLALGIAGAMTWDAAFFSGRIDTRFARPDVLLIVSLVLVALTLVACLIPAARASRLDAAGRLRQV